MTLAVMVLTWMAGNIIVRSQIQNHVSIMLSRRGTARICLVRQTQTLKQQGGVIVHYLLQRDYEVARHL
jgi:hypothetical protein